MVGKTCAYASRVIATVEWPSISGMGLGNRIGAVAQFRGTRWQSQATWELGRSDSKILREHRPARDTRRNPATVSIPRRQRCRGDAGDRVHRPRRGRLRRAGARVRHRQGPDRHDRRLPLVQKYAVKFEGGAATASAATLAELAEAVVAGDIVVPIQHTYTLDEVRAAFAELEAGHVAGKIVLIP